MRSRITCQMSGTSLMGFAIGMVAGLAAGFLAAPTRGSQLRATLRERATDGSARLQHWIEEVRRALRTRFDATEADRLSAPLGEIASMHSGSTSPTMGVVS